MMAFDMHKSVNEYDEIFPCGADTNTSQGKEAINKINIGYANEFRGIPTSPDRLFYFAKQLNIWFSHIPLETT